MPTIEKLGQAMYAQDREAWKATDLLRAERTDDQLKAENVHGWIVDTYSDHDVVRFIHHGPNGPEAGYDVTFFVGKEPVLSQPRDAKLSSAELAKYAARTLALKESELTCSKSYNTVVLPDTQRDGWLVWVMAATTDPNLIMLGRHYRFSISADGQTVREKDALSHDCLVLQKSASSDTFVVTHTLSPTPTEAHVFASLSYGLHFYVGTADGRAWKIDRGRVATIDLDAPGEDGVSARKLASRGENCAMLPADNGEKKTEDGPVVHVIEKTEESKEFTAGTPPGQKPTAITCVRQDIIPAPKDYKVLTAGFPLYIADKGLGHPYRIGVLELSGGQFRFRLIQGETLTDDLVARLRIRLDAFQLAIRAVH
jgi:hypothetical protein